MTKQVVRRWTIAATVAVLAVMAVPVADAARARRRSLTINDTVRLTLVRKDGNVLYERGTATGTFPGTVTARFTTSLTKVTGTVTFYPTGGGSITMAAVGYPTSTRTVTGLRGSIAVQSGSGKYARALGSGTFSGTANRRNWSVTVTAKANLTY